MLSFPGCWSRDKLALELCSSYSVWRPPLFRENDHIVFIACYLSACLIDAKWAWREKPRKTATEVHWDHRGHPGMCHQVLLPFLFLSPSLPSSLFLPFPPLPLPFPHSFFIVCFSFISFCCILTCSLNWLTTWVVTEFPWGFGGSPGLTKSCCQCDVLLHVDKMQSTESAITQLWTFSVSGF